MRVPQPGWRSLVAGLLFARYAFRLRLVRWMARRGLAAIE